MPLSRKANRDRMKQAMRVKRLAEFRLQQANSSPYQRNVVQPMTLDEASEVVKCAAGRRPDFPDGKDYVDAVRFHDMPELDADGNVIPEDV